MIAGPLTGLILLSAIGPAAADAGAPTRPADLFEPAKVWAVHLRFTPERWAAMEPAGGVNVFDPSTFGMEMFLAPLVMREGDRDSSGGLSAAEFRELGARWFAAWDGDGDGVLDDRQLRAGLKILAKPPGAEGDREGPPPGMTLQAKDGRRNGLSGLMGVDFAYVRADLDFEGRALPDVAARFKGNGTFLESRGSLKRSLKLDLNKYVKGQKLAGRATLNLHNNVTDAGMMHEAVAFRLYRDAGVPAPRTSYARVHVTVPGKHDRAYFGLYSLVENVDKDFLAERKFEPGTALFKPSMPDLFADLGDDWSAYRQGYDPKVEPSESQKRRVVAMARLVASAPDDEFAARLGEFVALDEFARFLAVTAWIGDLDSILTSGQNYYLALGPGAGRFRFIPWDKDHTFGSWIADDPADRPRHSVREPWEGKKRFLERAFRVEAFRARYLDELAKLNDGPARPDRIRALVNDLAAAARPAVAEESPAKLKRFEAVARGEPIPGNLFGLGFGKPTPSMLMYADARSRSVADQLAGRDEGLVLGRPKPGDAGKRPQGPPPFEDMVGPALVKALDADKDGKLARAEFVDGFGRWFDGWDAEHAGTLPEDRIRKGLNKALPFAFPAPPPPKPDAAETPRKDGAS